RAPNMTLKLMSTAFWEGDTVPRQYTADGMNVSPPLEWTGMPPGTRGFALTCDDPDAPSKTWVHWVLYNVPGEERRLPDGIRPREEVELPPGAGQGKNDFGKIGYGGPAPPRGKRHQYLFTLYALDAALDLPPGATEEQLRAAMKGHVLDQGLLTGSYGRS